MIQNSIERTQREIQNLHKNLSDESKKEADRSDKIFRAKQAAARSSSSSTIKSKLNEIERYEKEIVQIQKKKSDITKQIADQTKKLYGFQQQLSKEQDREQKKFLDSLQRQQNELRRDNEARITELTLEPRKSAERALVSENLHDAFISHASEDKDELVRPLAEKLITAGFSVWYDDYELTVGDSLRRSIDRGLSASRFGIVVLSPHFFAKNWTQYELDGLVAREMDAGSKVILPLWHKVSKDEVMRNSPSLAEKVALNTAMYTVDELVEQLSKVLRKAES
jgi:hypothetical protein